LVSHIEPSLAANCDAGPWVFDNQQLHLSRPIGARVGMSCKGDHGRVAGATPTKLGGPRHRPGRQAANSPSACTLSYTRESRGNQNTAIARWQPLLSGSGGTQPHVVSSNKTQRLNYLLSQERWVHTQGGDSANAHPARPGAVIAHCSHETQDCHACWKIGRSEHRDPFSQDRAPFRKIGSSRSFARSEHFSERSEHHEKIFQKSGTSRSFFEESEQIRKIGTSREILSIERMTTLAGPGGRGTNEVRRHWPKAARLDSEGRVRKQQGLNQRRRVSQPYDPPRPTPLPHTGVPIELPP